MQDAEQTEQETLPGLIHFHHGTELASANDLFLRDVNQQSAAVWNGSGEFWATTDHRRAEWFALSHPNSPPAACFEFDLPESILVAISQMNPVGALRHGRSDYEFLPVSFALLNQHMLNKRVVLVP
jgi:hypothetical protein